MLSEESKFYALDFYNRHPDMVPIRRRRDGFIVCFISAGRRYSVPSGKCSSHSAPCDQQLWEESFPKKRFVPGLVSVDADKIFKITCSQSLLSVVCVELFGMSERHLLESAVH